MEIMYDGEIKRDLQNLLGDHGAFGRLRRGSIEKEEELERLLLDYALMVNQKIKNNASDAIKEALRLEEVLISLSAYVSNERPWVENLIVNVYATEKDGIDIWED